MYKVTVELTEMVTKTEGKEWAVCGHDEEGQRLYAYTPEIEKEVEVTEVIYTQLVANLDLNAVIKAINKIP